MLSHFNTGVTACCLGNWWKIISLKFPSVISPFLRKRGNAVDLLSRGKVSRAVLATNAGMVGEKGYEANCFRAASTKVGRVYRRSKCPAIDSGPKQLHEGFPFLRITISTF